MHVLVTGGAGYIGSVAAEELIKAGHTVTVFDNLSRGHLGAVPSGASFFHGDLLRPETIDRCLSEQVPESEAARANRSFNARE